MARLEALKRKKKLADPGSQVRIVTPADFDRLMKDEEAKLKRLAASGVLKP